ncbi:MAG: hypothetical protein KF688_07895 [Pirellulales bacterium]|nr:hypothetical protein [Pirellulales bacterium]
MKKQLIHISPLRTGIVLGALYGLLALTFLPFLLIAIVFSDNPDRAPNVFVVIFPVLYALGGFVGGVIAAALYNLVAKWTDGLEFEVRDVYQ